MKCPKCGTEMKPMEKSEILDMVTWYECPKCDEKHHIFEAVLLKYREPIWNEIESYFYHEIPGVSDLKNEVVEEKHWEMVTDYPKRKGKYTRPSLLCLTAEAMEVPLDNVIRTAAAMQTSEDWILIHDDWQDCSDRRRGKPALHHIYGPELAINAGDSLHLIMWRMLRDNFDILDNETALRIMDEFYAMLQRTTLGQTAEMLWIQQRRYDLTEDDAYYIIDGKTSYYSLAGPMRLGAILAGADEDILSTISEFGTYLGRAFQIRDDLLDLESDFRGLKERGGDIKEGKRSLILIHLLNHADESDRRKVIDVLEKPRDEIGKDDIDLVIGLMEKYGSLEHGHSEAKKWAEKALDALNTRMDFLKGEPREHIRWAVDFMLTRDF